MPHRLLIPSLVALAALALSASADEKDRSDGMSVGQKAPAWRLNDHTGKARSSTEASNARWYLLAFFPKAATPG